MQCYDWSIFATEFAAFLLADLKYAQFVKCESTIKELVSTYSPIADLARSMVKLSISLKLQISEKLAEPKATQSSVAKQFGVSRKNIQNVIANKELLRGVEIAKHSHKRCHLKVEQKYEDVSEATYQWLLQMRERHGEVPIVESVVCAKAMRFANLLNKPDFKASKGWFTCWKNRYGLNLYKVRNLSNSNIQIFGERRDVLQDNVEVFLVDLQKLKDEYRDENIFNADETALFYHLLPERTIERNHLAAVGKNSREDRVTLLLCCSATGEKLPPLVIGKYESPRCLRGIDHKKLPCSYKSSRNAWMTTSLWSSWLSELNSRIVLQKRHILFC